MNVNGQLGNGENVAMINREVPHSENGEQVALLNDLDGTHIQLDQPTPADAEAGVLELQPTQELGHEEVALVHKRDVNRLQRNQDASPPLCHPQDPNNESSCMDSGLSSMLGYSTAQSGNNGQHRPDVDQHTSAASMAPYSQVDRGESGEDSAAHASPGCTEPTTAQPTLVSNTGQASPYSVPSNREVSDPMCNSPYTTDVPGSNCDMDLSTTTTRNGSQSNIPNIVSEVGTQNVSGVPKLSSPDSVHSVEFDSAKDRIQPTKQLTNVTKNDNSGAQMCDNPLYHSNASEEAVNDPALHHSDDEFDSEMSELLHRGGHNMAVPSNYITQDVFSQMGTTAT